MCKKCVFTQSLLAIAILVDIIFFDSSWIILFVILVEIAILFGIYKRWRVNAIARLNIEHRVHQMAKPALQNGRRHRRAAARSGSSQNLNTPVPVVALIDYTQNQTPQKVQTSKKKPSKPVDQVTVDINRPSNDTSPHASGQEFGKLFSDFLHRRFEVNDNQIGNWVRAAVQAQIDYYLYEEQVELLIELLGENRTPDQTNLLYVCLSEPLGIPSVITELKKVKAAPLKIVLDQACDTAAAVNLQRREEQALQTGIDPDGMRTEGPNGAMSAVITTQPEPVRKNLKDIITETLPNDGSEDDNPFAAALRKANATVGPQWPSGIE